MRQKFHNLKQDKSSYHFITLSKGIIRNGEAFNVKEKQKVH